MGTRISDLFLSLLLPGAGQIRQGRSAAAVAFLAATAGALAGLFLAERFAIAGVIPLVALLVTVVWAAVDAWRGSEHSDRRGVDRP